MGRDPTKASLTGRSCGMLCGSAGAPGRSIRGFGEEVYSLPTLSPGLLLPLGRPKETPAIPPAGHEQAREPLVEHKACWLGRTRAPKMEVE